MTDVALQTLSALVAACEAAPAFSGVEVRDGPIVSDSSATERLFIGSTLDDPSIAIEATLVVDSLPGIIDIWQFAIPCVMECWSGDTSDIVTKRARAIDLYRTVGTLIKPTAQQITLNVPGLSYAQLGAWTLHQSQTTKGLYVGVAFRVECMTRPVAT
jgi:hypothetical protein